MTYDDLYAQALAKSSKQIAESIDASIMYLMLKSAGWTEVHVKGRNINELNTWSKKFCVGKYKLTSEFYIFEKEKDATLFSLKWS